MFIQSRTMLLLLAGAVAVGGCALPTRIKTRNIQVPSIAASPEGPALTIAEVRDTRSTGVGALEERKSRDPNIAARAYGTKGVGLTTGTIVLPEGRTVAQVVEEAVAEGFRRAGYVVLDEGDQGIEEALPVNVDIHEFWTWKDSRTHFDAQISITAPMEPFTDPVKIGTETIVKPKSYLTLWLLRLDRFRTAKKKGVEALIEEVARVAESGITSTTAESPPRRTEPEAGATRPATGSDFPAARLRSRSP